MCGIAGIFSYNSDGPPVDEGGLLRVRDAMTARGPEGAGWWVSRDQHVGLAHRRLAFQDLSEAGKQPMSAFDGDLQIVFNGEIYNHPDLRRSLRGKGHCFHSHSDTEVLLHLYAEYGLEMFQHLRGMYAFALWDSRRRRLLLARDPFGIKPLYYSDEGGCFRFASQVKALLASRAIGSEASAAAHVGFFLLGYVPEPLTLYKQIKSVPAGSFIILAQDCRSRIQSFCDVTAELAAANDQTVDVSDAEIALRIESAISDSVEKHLISDVPVGVFLSAGLDSTTIAALGSRDGNADLRSVTLGFRDYDGTHNDETVYATETAHRLGIAHRTQWISRRNFELELDHLLAAMDQPSIDGVNTYFVSLVAREAGLKAALSGLGGDEMFGGYSSFTDIPRLMKLSHRFSNQALGAIVRRLLVPIVGRFSSPKYAGLLEYSGNVGAAYLLRRALYMPWELDSILDKQVVVEGLRELDLVDLIDRTKAGGVSDRLMVASLEMGWYMKNQLLRDSDWAGMAHSLEIRVPFLDLPLLREIMPLVISRPAMQKADFLRKILAQKLSPKTLNRPKSGFTMPVEKWLTEAHGDFADRGLRGWSRFIAKQFDFPLVEKSVGRLAAQPSS